MKISIIISTYNRGTLLPRACKSIVHIANIEIIIVDDGSNDNTKEIIQGLLSNDNRIMPIFLDKNVGVNAARNAGIHRATGNWVCFLDSDDEYLPGALEKMIITLDEVKKNIDVVGFMTMRETGNVMEPCGYRTKEQWNIYEPTYEDIVLKRNIDGDVDYCIRRKLFVRGYKFASYINGFELLFFAELAKDCIRIIYINASTILVHTDAVNRLSTDSYLRYPKQFVSGYEDFTKSHYIILKKYSDTLLHFYLRIAKCYFRINSPKAFLWLLKSFLVNPIGFLKMVNTKIIHSIF